MGSSSEKDDEREISFSESEWNFFSKLRTQRTQCTVMWEESWDHFYVYCRQSALTYVKFFKQKLLKSDVFILIYKITKFKYWQILIYMQNFIFVLPIYFCLPTHFSSKYNIFHKVLDQFNLHIFTITCFARIDFSLDRSIVSKVSPRKKIFTGSVFISSWRTRVQRERKIIIIPSTICMKHDTPCSPRKQNENGRERERERGGGGRMAEGVAKTLQTATEKLAWSERLFWPGFSLSLHSRKLCRFIANENLLKDW